MTQFLKVFQDGWVVFGKYLFEVIAFFITSYGIGLFFSQVFGKSEFENFVFSQNIGIGVLLIPIFVLIGVLCNGHIFLFRLISWILFCVSTVFMVLQLLPIIKAGDTSKWRIFFFSIGLIILLIITRLAFLNNSIFPSYSDSVTHYKIIENLINPTTKEPGIFSFSASSLRYYHIGFHLLTIWVISFFGLPVEKGILLTGQLLLVVASLTIYSLVFQFTHERKTAILAAIVSGFAWQIPSFSVNWGKFPALASLVLFPVTFSCILKFGQSWKSDIKSKILFLLLLSCNVLFHSRIFFYILFAFICYFFPQFFERLSKRTSLLILFFLFVITIIGIWIDMNSFFDYFGGKLTVGFFLILFLPFAVRYYPKLTISCLSFFIILLYTSMISSTITLFGSITQLMDTSFILISLYIPISIIIVCGFIGVMRLLPLKISMVTTILVGMLILLKVDIPNIIYPHPCCDYIRSDEIDTFSWISENTELTQLLLIPGMQMADYQMAMDGGAWITTLTHRPVEIMSSDYIWNTDDGHEKVCKLGNALIFIGGKASSFQDEYFQRKDWYQKVYENSSDSIYKIIGCK